MPRSQHRYETPTLRVHAIQLGVFGCYNGEDIEENLPVIIKPSDPSDIFRKLD